ncbi:MAG: hypothetical protein KKH94_08375, partial [Candidatus Omnitrophica bacterium]|nr:hypothetical protein [Candidatus Omnitrophota bacterium]
PPIQPPKPTVQPPPIQPPKPTVQPPPIQLPKPTVQPPPIQPPKLAPQPPPIQPAKPTPPPIQPPKPRPPQPPPQPPPRPPQPIKQQKQADKKKPVDKADKQGAKKKSGGGIGSIIVTLVMMVLAGGIVYIWQQGVVDESTVMFEMKIKNLETQLQEVDDFEDQVKKVTQEKSDLQVHLEDIKSSYAQLEEEKGLLESDLTMLNEKLEVAEAKKNELASTNAKLFNNLNAEMIKLQKTEVAKTEAEGLVGDLQAKLEELSGLSSE